MKFTKRLLTIALSMGMVMPLCATAYAAKTVTNLSAKVEPNATDSSLYDVTVTFSVADSSKQMSLLLTGPNTDNNLDDNDVVHINQFGKNEPDEAVIVSGSGTCTFSVSKERMTAAGATVNESAGTTTLHVIMGADDATESISVAATYGEPTSTTEPVTGVTLGDASIDLTVGDTRTLVAVVAPADATNQNVTWSSSNTDVAKVDANGKVTAVAKGTATITVKTEDGNKTATCTVTVTEASSIRYGDVNGDGSVTPKDGTVLARYLAKWAGYDESKINMDAADVNGDGSVTPKDGTVLARYLAKWTGYGTLPKK